MKWLMFPEVTLLSRQRTDGSSVCTVHTVSGMIRMNDSALISILNISSSGPSLRSFFFNINFPSLNEPPGVRTAAPPHRNIYPSTGWNAGARRWITGRRPPIMLLRSGAGKRSCISPRARYAALSIWAGGIEPDCRPVFMS